MVRACRPFSRSARPFHAAGYFFSFFSAFSTKFSTHLRTTSLISLPSWAQAILNLLWSSSGSFMLKCFIW